MRKKSVVKKGKKCTPCTAAKVLGIALDICSTVSDEKKCDELYDKLIDDKITPEKAIAEIKHLAKGHKKQMEALNYVDKVIRS